MAAAFAGHRLQQRREEAALPFWQKLEIHAQIWLAARMIQQAKLAQQAAPQTGSTSKNSRRKPGQQVCPQVVDLFLVKPCP